MTILVIGGTGTVGSDVVAGLVRRGSNVRVLTRLAEKLNELPRGAKGAVGDLARPSTLKQCFDGVESVFLITPLNQHETELGLAAVDAAKKAGVKRLVYMSVMMPKDSVHIPHFKSKIPVEQAVKESGIAWTLLRPNNFFQNDYWCQAAIMTYNTYPQPIGLVGLNRVDVRDIADAAINALTAAGHEGQEYPLNGSELLTGDSVAKVYSKHLGREIKYAGDNLDTWSKQSRHMMPEWMVKDFRIMYDYFQKHGLKATDIDMAKQNKILGRPPRTFDEFVGEVVQKWKKW